VRQRESFVFETVFSDPVGDKLSFLKAAAQSGYTVVLCFIGVSGPETSEQRVAMRVSQGGHDVPAEKLISRYPRTMSNLEAASASCPASSFSTMMIWPLVQACCSRRGRQTRWVRRFDFEVARKTNGKYWC